MNPAVVVRLVENVVVDIVAQWVFRCEKLVGFSSKEEIPHANIPGNVRVLIRLLKTPIGELRADVGDSSWDKKQKREVSVGHGSSFVFSILEIIDPFRPPAVVNPHVGLIDRYDALVLEVANVGEVRVSSTAGWNGW